MIRRHFRSPATAVAVFALTLSACGDQGPSATAVSSVAPSVGQPEPVAIVDLAHAVVQIVSYVDGRPDALGSGTLISADGLILTNAHVVYPEDGELDRLEIGVTEASDAVPEPTFLAEIAAADGALDLAVLRITERIDGGAVSDDLPHVELGQSDDLEIGDALRILGYPGIGGETITLTSGQVSGFVSEAGLGQRAWVKTDATIAGGNSGGLAANERGELIAVPTNAGATDEVVDCRAVRDTNRDGSIDDEDDCVPIGGFLNGLRPVELAMDMIKAVQAGVAYEPIAEYASPIGSTDLEDVYWTDPVFGTEATASDEPVGEAIAFATGATSVCAFWDYEGMQPGMGWSAEWSRDGRLDMQSSFAEGRWLLEPDGRFWACVEDNAGLDPGVYDVALLVEDEVFSTGYFHVGDGLATTNVTIRNAGEAAVCYLMTAPYVATVWGVDHLGEADVLSPGETVTFELVSDDYDFLGEDCDAGVLFEGPIVVPGGESVVLEWSENGLVFADDAGDPLGTDLQVGDCFNGDPGWTRANAEVVDCSTPHDQQIVGIVPYSSADGAFPGEAAIDQLGEETCYDAFEDFVGIGFQESRWYMTSWMPTPETWAAGSRVIICALHAEDESPIVGSMEGAGE